MLKKPEFLFSCYQEIHGGENYKTPPNEEWFINLGNLIVKGQFHFARLVNSSRIPLQDEIVYKALITIMEEIWKSPGSTAISGPVPYNSTAFHNYEHSALKTIHLKGGNYTWVIQGDLIVDSIPYEIIMNIVKKEIKCSRTLELIKKALVVGYVYTESKTQNVFHTKVLRTFESPNIVNLFLTLSSLVCNIVLKEFDKGIAKFQSKFNAYDPIQINPKQYSKYNITTTGGLNLSKSLYVRCGHDFLIFVSGRKMDAIHIRLRILDYLRSKGLSLSMNASNSKVLSTKKGFGFLGAICKRVSVPSPLHIRSLLNQDKAKRIYTTQRMRMNVDSNIIYKNLVERRFARFSNHSPLIPQGTAKNSIINYSHAYILKLYNLEIKQVLTYYSFAVNRSILWDIIWLMHQSCALTLAKKYKIRSMAAIFKKFGRSLDCPYTGVKLYLPESLKAIHDYKINDKGNLKGTKLSFNLTMNSQKRNFHLIRVPTLYSLCIPKREFSTKVYNSTEQISPYFVTGFTDAEGCFRLKISKNNKYALGWVVQAEYVIHLHEKDLTLLKEIQIFFGGIGIIYKGQKNSVSYSISARKDLVIVLAHFDKYPLITDKFRDYLLFRSAFAITSKGPLDANTLQELVNIRSVLNRGLTQLLKQAFPLTTPVDKPKRGIVEIPHGDWVAGFTAGEGHFSVFLGKPRGRKQSVSAVVVFTLTQHSRDEQLMESLIKYLGCGHFYRRVSEKGVDFKCRTLEDNCEKIIPFFQKYVIHGAKGQEFKHWCRIAYLVKKKTHLTPEGLSEIKQIQYKMNTQTPDS